MFLNYLKSCRFGKLLMESLVDGYTASTDVFANQDTRILNCTHTDLDGGSSAIVVKNMYPNCQTVQVNYAGSPQYSDASQKIVSLADTYDAIVFSDFCPDANLINVIHSVNKPYLVLDHHGTAQRVEDPMGKFELDTTKCGALLCLDYFSQYKDMEYLRSLCVITDDHDRWVRKIIPLSDELNSVFFLIGFDAFVEKYMHGLNDNDLFPDDRELLATHDQEVTEYINSRPTKMLPHNGIYLGDCWQFISDLNIRLSDKYDWIVFATPLKDDPSKTKLSFRTKLKTINLGAILQSIGLGGGGHPGAAGQIIDTDKVDWFIDEVVKRTFGE